MKRLGWMTVVAIMWSALSLHAQTNTFHVAVTGTISEDAGKLKISSADLLTSANNALVLVYDQTDGFLLLAEENTNTTLAANVILGSSVSAKLVAGTFNASMVAYGEGLASTAVTNLPPPTPVLNGAMQMIGKLNTGGSKTTLSATLQGVWTDPHVTPSGQPAALFKGTIKSLGPAPLPAFF
ncbi:MAG TPA: hypothetical protein VMP11_20415 [Verrucomicrobiae bacterium]|nr:hypothetical protein [Verrucomicrobiae bacterium]